jgi:cholesterol transport system auxiliary component
MTAVSKIVSGACLIVIMTSAAGCFDLKKSYPEKRSFVLDVGEPQHEAAADGTIVLRINKFRVSPLFAGRAMVYRVAELQYESDFYDEWFVAPGTLVTQQVHRWLSSSAGIQLVVMGTNHVEPTHLLEGTVTEFYGDFRESPRAVLGLELHVIDAIHERQQVFRRMYRQDVPLRERSSDALAQGLTEALRAILIDVARELAALERVRPPTSSSRP